MQFMKDNVVSVPRCDRGAGLVVRKGFNRDIIFGDKNYKNALIWPNIL